MSNHTIATPITTWAEVRATDREVLNGAKVAALLTLDPRAVDHAIEDGTIPAVHIGRSRGGPRERGSGSVTTYAVKGGTRWRYEVTVPVDPARPEDGDRKHPAAATRPPTPRSPCCAPT